MNTPSSTIQAAAYAAAGVSTFLLLLKIVVPEVYAQIPPEYHGYLVGAISCWIGYKKKENVLPLLRDAV